ncbi:DUF58 domain-containing protein [Roseibacillus persicicus]|uniref:DUF58 domain-containing protein n=1 Tax=Roseibacillus persicicus TaxID=454148 RepID=UPI00398B26E2
MSESQSTGTLTSPAFIQRLESLFLLARRVLGGTLQADRKSRKKGTGITFADYAEYRLGDDFRAIDWRVYARFDQLVIKLFELEEDATIYLLFDSSQSMESKIQTAKELTAAMAYIGLYCLDRVAIYGMADSLKPLLEPGRGKGKVFPMLRALEEAQTFGSDTDFTACVREFQARHRKKGMVIVVSDFLYPKGFEGGLKRLAGLGHDVFAIQVHDTADLTCDWKGDVEVECIETQKRERLTVTRKEAQAYEAAITKWNEDLRKECARRGIGLAATTNEVPFDEVVQGILRKGGLVA